MTETEVAIIASTIYIVGIIVVDLVWIFVSPYDNLDLLDIHCLATIWPICLILMILFLPFKALEGIQNSRRIAISKKKYYDEDEYRSENEDWYSEE